MNSMSIQCLLGMACDNFCILAADMSNTQSIIVMKNDEDKITEASNSMMIGVVGDAGDRVQFSQFIAKNIQLYSVRNQYTLSTTAAVNFTRKNLADALRSRTPYLINMLIGGYDNEDKGQLFFLDFLATCVKVPYAAHGLSGYFCIGILGKLYKPDLTESEAYEIIKVCVNEVHQRFLLNLTNFQVKVADKNGIRSLPVISPASLCSKT